MVNRERSIPYSLYSPVNIIIYIRYIIVCSVYTLLFRIIFSSTILSPHRDHSKTVIFIIIIVVFFILSSSFCRRFVPLGLWSSSSSSSWLSSLSLLLYILVIAANARLLCTCAYTAAVCRTCFQPPPPCAFRTLRRHLSRLRPVWLVKKKIK